MCWREAGEQYALDPRLLAAVAYVESRYNPLAVRKPFAAGNRDGTTDFGVMQINSRELPGLRGRGITAERLLSDPCLNVKEGARILREKIQRVGITWRAVGAYNTGEKGSPERQRRYVSAVQTAYRDMLDEPLPGTEPAPAPAGQAIKPQTATPPPPFVIEPEPEDEAKSTEVEENNPVVTFEKSGP
jgi:hypothetical protein